MTSVSIYLRQHAQRLKDAGRTRTSETYLATLSSFTKFCNGQDIDIARIDTNLIERYESYLKGRHLSRNSSSFYMRILRRIYNLAVSDGLASPATPFRTVYTGIDKTARRAISMRDLRAVRSLVLPLGNPLDLARDMFLFSFYMRGMSFVDMAYLRKCDLRNGFVTYNRKKTGQQLSVRWERPMQEIVDKYDTGNSSYLLPIIQREDGTERRQYLNRLLYVNRKLKLVAKMVAIRFPLTMYVARHSWASIAHERNIPLHVIRDALGHDNEATTQIYITSIHTNQIDAANREIIGLI